MATLYTDFSNNLRHDEESYVLYLTEDQLARLYHGTALEWLGLDREAFEDDHGVKLGRRLVFLSVFALHLDRERPDRHAAHGKVRARSE